MTETGQIGAPPAEDDAPPAAPRPALVYVKPYRHRHWLRDVVEVLLIALILYLIIWNALQTVRVDGSSMETTLHNNDLLLASKISYRIGTPHRGDIVIFVPPVDPTKDFIKRVIGEPGDVLEIDDGGPGATARVLIKPGGKGSFQLVNEPYVTSPWSQDRQCCDAKGLATTQTATPVTVPPDSYFLMGDNRNHSEDSRLFGFVKRDAIVAKAFVRIWPPFNFDLGPSSTLTPAFLALPLWWFGPRRKRRRAA